MYRTPRNRIGFEEHNQVRSRHQPEIQTKSHNKKQPEIMSSMIENIFMNPTVRDNINQILRILFRSLIEELYPYIVATLVFMVISFILLIAIFILLLWREKNTYSVS